MATLLKEFDNDHSTISFTYEKDEADSLPIWGDSFEVGEKDEKDVTIVTVGKKLFDKSGIAVYEVLAARAVFNK